MMRLLFLILTAFLALPALGENVVPVQANTNGLLLSPSPFFKTNVFGAGNISIHPLVSGTGIIISNTSGDVTLIQLNTTSNSLKTNLMDFDRITSNYLYSLIVGGGAGEVNVLGNAGATNATRFGLPSGKSGVTNLVKSIEPAYGLKGTNEGGTNFQMAVDLVIIPNQIQLNTASNVVRTFANNRHTNTFNTNQFAGGTNVSIKTAANVTNLNSVGVQTAVSITASGTIEADELVLPVVSPGAETMFFADASGLVTALAIGPHLSFSAGLLSASGFQPASANLTNWSLFPTNVWNSRQGGSIILSNFLAMGITNIIAGTNTIIYTNAGNLVINALPGVPGVLSTNANQFGAATILTIKNQARLTNMISTGTLTGEGIDLSSTLTVAGATVLSGSVTLNVAGMVANKLLGLDINSVVQSIVMGNGIVFDGTNLSAEVTTIILNAASNVLRNFTISSDITTSNALRVVSGNTTFTSLLQQTNPPIVKTISAGANLTLTNQVTNIVIAASGGFGSPITITNFTNTVLAWSPPTGTARIRIRAWGAGGDGGAASGANPGTGGGGGAYGESTMAATAASSFDLFVGIPSSTISTYVRTAGGSVDLMRLAGGTNGTSGSEPTFSGGPGGNVVLADWGVGGEKGWYRDNGFFGGFGGSAFASSGGQGGNDWTPGVAVGYGDGRNGRNPGGGGGGARGNIASTGGVGGLGMIVIESFGSP